MFDKLLYWKRRNDGRRMTGRLGQTMEERGGKRGQGDKLPKFSDPVNHLGMHQSAVSDKQPTKKALLKNTKRARKQSAQH